MKRNIRAPHTLPPKLALHLLHALPPSLGHKLLRVRAPHVLVNVHAVRVPTDPGACGDGDTAAQEGGLGGDAVDELGDRWVEAEELVDGGGENGEAVELVGGGVGNFCCENFGAEGGLESLVCAHFPEDRIKELLSIFVGGEEGNFEVGAVLGVVYFPFGKGVIEHVDEEVVFGVAWFAGAIARAVLD